MLALHQAQLPELDSWWQLCLQAVEHLRLAQFLRQLEVHVLRLTAYAQ